jgi:LmbE family N-acetylglucosaminyl deacetylase
MTTLVVAPHCDDESLGVGGTIARLSAEGRRVVVAVLTGHGEQTHPLWPRAEFDTVREEAREACRVLGVSELLFREIPAARVAEIPPHVINNVTREVLESVKPEQLFVPFSFDLHKDHRELFHSFSVAWRPGTAFGAGVRDVYAYETQSETHWNAPYVEPGFLPNTWIDISAHLETKLKALASYKSQVRPAPDARSLEAVRALAVWRGSQVSVAAAEAFVSIRRLI